MARRKPPAKSNTLRLNKINVAEAHIVTAVNLFFENGHPVSVYTLASAAREILTTLGVKQGIETLLHQMATWKGETLKQQINKAHAFANFFKHANTDPTAVLEFPEDEVDGIRFIACHDFGRITGGLPVPAQVYEAFWLAKPIRQRRSCRDVSRASSKICSKPSTAREARSRLNKSASVLPFCSER